jgi:hypothetical protein
VCVRVRAVTDGLVIQKSSFSRVLLNDLWLF